MRWTALDRFGVLVNVDGDRVSFGAGLIYAPEAHIAAPYAPVAAADAGVTVLLYRGHEDDSVRVLASTGWAATLATGSVTNKWAKGCDGKWPLGLTLIGHRQFRATWLLPGLEDGTVGPRKRRGVADLDFAGPVPLVTPQAPVAVAEDHPLVLLDFDGTHCEYEVGGNDPRTVTRNGVTLALGYSSVVGGRVVGHDASTAANRILLADTDGLFVVCESDAAVRFPARLDVHGNVACFEGQYFTLADIRTRPVLAGLPDLPPEVPEPPTAEQNADAVKLSACRRDVADLEATIALLSSKLPKERVFTTAEVRQIVAVAVGQLPRWMRSLGVPPAVRQAVDGVLRSSQ
jgi:hypothetical protein